MISNQKQDNADAQYGRQERAAMGESTEENVDNNVMQNAAPGNQVPEFKEMSYTNISSVRNDLKSLAQFFNEISSTMHSTRFSNNFSDNWRKIERSIKLIEQELNLNNR